MCIRTYENRLRSIIRPLDLPIRNHEDPEFYAKAADRARAEDWPDEAWKEWRYRRASLARLLAHEGLMREASEIYGRVRARYALPPPPVWQRVTSFLTEN
jgi:hypothetical protein